VASAAGLSLGTAVPRNRIRRRLREAVHAARGELEPGRAYLLGARPETTVMPYRELVSTLEHLLRSARESR
jgi:ribonuclease P protein component